MDLSDPVLQHLCEVVDLPDLTGTRYEIDREIGRGGLGVVYAAHDRELDRQVALKVMDAALSAEPRLIARLEHPAIVPVYETGVLPDGRVYYAMKLLAGARMDTFLDSAASLAERLRVIQRVGEALSFAHSRGILHRDLKPQNIMVGAFGEVYVMDWGIDAVAGTPAFRAPEGPRDERSDIYALGALLKLSMERPKPVPQLLAIAARAMNPDAAKRYHDAAAFLSEIERYQSGLAVEAYPESPWETALRYARQNAVLLWLLAAFAAVKFFLFFLRAG